MAFMLSCYQPFIQLFSNFSMSPKARMDEMATTVCPSIYLVATAWHLHSRVAYICTKTDVLHLNTDSLYVLTHEAHTLLHEHYSYSHVSKPAFVFLLYLMAAQALDAHLHR